MRRALLAAACLLATLAFLPVPSVQASPPDCAASIGQVGLVCNGTYWCETPDAICAQEVCAANLARRNVVCVLSPP